MDEKQVDQLTTQILCLVEKAIREMTSDQFVQMVEKIGPVKKTPTTVDEVADEFKRCGIPPYRWYRNIGSFGTWETRTAYDRELLKAMGVSED